MAEYNMPQYILREFKVTDARVCQALVETFKLCMLMENMEYTVLFSEKVMGTYIVRIYFPTVI